jgi:hypothetical protein
MATLKWKFQEDGERDELILKGEYSRDWQPWKNGQGYFGRAFVPFKGGLTLCVDMQIWGKSTRGWRTKKFIGPPATDLCLAFPFGDLFFDAGTVLLRIRAQECIELARRQEKQYLQENHPAAISVPGIRYRIMVAIQVKDQLPNRSNVSWQPSQPMTYSGGLPETNRNRH